MPGPIALRHAAVELHAARRPTGRSAPGEEQAVEQVLGRVFGRRLARTHHAVDGDQRGHLVLGLVDAQRVADVRALVEVVTCRADLRDARFAQLLDPARR